MGRKRDSAAAPPAAAENVRVLVRARPLNSKELESGYKSCVDLDIAEGTVSVNHVCGEPDRWTFDAVINNTFSQKDVFTQHILPLVDSVLEGFNATVFAYGQSGSGKTFTMTGKYDDPDLCGVIPRTFAHIFSVMRASTANNPNKKFNVSCSFVELYNGKVRDLLAKQQVPLAVKENKDKTFFVQGAHIPQVKYPEDLERHMEEGTERRQVASTELNSDSSRSHSIFSLIVESVETTDDGDVRSVTSKLNLVDLAGSERQSKTGAQGDTLKEGCNINLSLSALGTVIDTIVKGKGHVPFRSSPLTMLLKDSLGGSSKTVMFANINPSEHNVSETVSTLRFADRAKQIKNKPVVNMDAKDQKISELTDLVADLKEKLKRYESGNAKGLEEELEEMRERLGNLEVALDNAERGREADAVEATERIRTLESDLQAREAAATESQGALEQLRRDVAMLEEYRRIEASNMADILRHCSEKLESPEPLTTVDELIRAFDVVERWAGDVRLARRERDEAIAERAHVEATLTMDMEALEAVVKSKDDEVQALEKKSTRLKDQLEEQLQARRTAAADMSLNASTLSVTGVAGGGEGGSEELLAAERRLREREEAFAATQQALYDRLAELTSESAVVGSLCELLQAKDELLRDARLSMADAIAYRGSPRSPRRRGQRTHSVGEGTVTGDRRDHTDSQGKLVSLVAALAADAPCTDDTLHEALTELRSALDKLRDENAQLNKRLIEQTGTVGREGDGSPLSARRSVKAESPMDMVSTADGMQTDEVRPTVALVKVVRDFITRASSLNSAESFERELAALSMQVDDAVGGGDARLAKSPSPNQLNPVLLSDDDEPMADLQQQLAGLTESQAVVLVELSNVRLELDEERERRERYEKELAVAHDTILKMKREAAEHSMSVSKLQAQMAEYVEERARAAVIAERHAHDVADVERRLQERSAQLTEVRGLVQTQMELLSTANTTQSELTAQLRAAKAELVDEERRRAALVAEREEAVQRAANRRIEALTAKHREDLEKKDVDTQKLRKKLRKLEGNVHKAQELYDQKVCEVADLQHIIEEQKVEALRMLRSPEARLIDVHTTQIGDALTRAKEEHKRRNELFAYGNGGGSGGAPQPTPIVPPAGTGGRTNSGLGETRAAGPAAAFLRRAAKQ